MYQPVLSVLTQFPHQPGSLGLMYQPVLSVQTQFPRQSGSVVPLKHH